MRNWLLNLSLKKKNILLILLIVLSLFLTECYNRKNSYDQYRLKIIEKDVQILNIYENYLDSVFQDIENVAYSIVGDQELQQDLRYMQHFTGKKGYSASLKRAHELLYMYYGKETYLQSILFYTDQYLFRYGDGEAGLNIRENIPSYIKEAEGKNGKTCMLSEEKRIILVKEMRCFDEQKIENLGYLIACVDFDAIIMEIRKKFPTESADFGLAIYDGDICLYNSNPFSEQMRKEADGWYVEEEDLVTVHTLPNLGYKMILRTYYGDVQHQTRLIYITSFLFSLLLAVTSALLASFLIKFVTGDMEILIRRMDDYGRGKLPDKEEEQKYRNRKDEIGTAHRHFSKMAFDYKRLTDEYYESENLRKEMEFIYLQKQIQPHFLYNTLSAISWMAYANQDSETAQVVEKMGRMMRMITDDKDPLSNVERELLMVEDYVSIQKLRFGNRLNVEIDISDQTRTMRIPKITLQPFVENSITHAMDQMLSQCRIRIYDRRDGDITEIIVEDNGEGFAEDILERLDQERRSETEANGSQGTGIALRNIHVRLQHVFSEDCGLRFQKLDGGMQVIVRIRELEKGTGE